MKLKSITLAALLPIAAYSQKVDLDKFSITTSVRQLPTAIKDTTYKTYSIESAEYADISYATVPLNNAQNLQIEGLKKINGTGHYVVKIKFIDARIERNGVEEIPKFEKNKEGVVTKQWTLYRPYIEYKISFSTELFDYKGAKLSNVHTHEGLSGTSKDRKYYLTSTEYSKYSEASDYYSNNYRSIFKKLVGDEFNIHLGASQSKLNELIGFPVNNSQNYLWINDSKKHPEFDKQQAIIAEFKTWSSQITGSRSLNEDEIKKANEFLDYFESVKKKYATDEKADKKLRYSAFYNKGIIYLFFLDNPSKAYDEGAGLIANEYDEKDGKWLQTQADNLKMSLDKAKKKTRHFDIDLSNVKGPNE